MEWHTGMERVLLSYDVTGIARPRAARVCPIGFGRVRRLWDGEPERMEKGFVHRPGVVWIGQSVLVLPRRDADELPASLPALGARLAAPGGFGVNVFTRRGAAWPARRRSHGAVRTAR